jgi:hypothetical protein
MNVELTKEDLIFIDMLLSKAEGGTRIEIHHCKHREYRDFLEKRVQHIEDLLARIKNALSAVK